MALRAGGDPGRFGGHVEAVRGERDLFADFYDERPGADVTIAGLRRRRRRALNDFHSATKTISLVEENGALYWRDGVPARTPSRERRRSGRRGDETDAGSLVLTHEFPTLAPNRVVAAVGALDRRLNPAIDESLQSRLRQMRRTPAGTFEVQAGNVTGPFTGRTLLFVHGMFVSAASLLEEFTAAGAPGRRLLERATAGKRYDRVLFFDHPTLSVSPMINALELGRAMAGSSGTIDVIAHSRGGLVVRWWLEAFGGSLARNARVRAVLAGSPLRGTSLAAPDKIQHAMSLLSNIGTLAEKTLGLAAGANPFLWVAPKILEVLVSVTGALWKAPLLDAAAVLIPGLAAQSAVENNHEINRLRTGPAAIDPAYYTVLSNFETEDPAWRFWRNFRQDRLGHLAASIVFPGTNDLVVDTASMTSFGVPGLRAAGACDFRTSSTVWHGNYFRQKRTIDYIADRFGA